MRNTTLLLLASMALAALVFSTDAHAKKMHGTKRCDTYSYAKVLKVGASKSNPRDRIRQRIYEVDSACNPKQDMTWFKDSKGKPILRRKNTSWLPKDKKSH